MSYQVPRLSFPHPYIHDFICMGKWQWARLGARVRARVRARVLEVEDDQTVKG